MVKNVKVLIVLIRHIVSWNFKEGLTEEEKCQNGQAMKEQLEALATIIPGVISIEVRTDLLAASNRAIVLNSLFESEETLAAYQIHPEHVQVSNFVGTFAADRTCIDYVE